MENIKHFIKAMELLYPSVRFAYHGDDNPSNETEFNERMKWSVGATEDNGTIYGDKPDEVVWNDVKAKLDELQAEYDAQDYARKRKVAYPDIYDYMDGIVKNDQTQIDKYIADSQAVKARYKKG